MKGGMGMMGDGEAKVTKEQFLEHAEERFAHMDAGADANTEEHESHHPKP